MIDTAKRKIENANRKIKLEYEEITTYLLKIIKAQQEQIKQLESDVVLLKDANENLIDLNNKEKETVAKLMKKLIAVYKKLQDKRGDEE